MSGPVMPKDIGFLYFRESSLIDSTVVPAINLS